MGMVEANIKHRKAQLENNKIFCVSLFFQVGNK